MSCSNPSGGGEEGGGSPSSAKAITGLTIEGLTLGEDAIAIDPETRTVTVTVPQGTALTGLSPAIALSPGVSIDPASGAAQDFFTTGGYSPVPYTVTGEDGSETVWTVTVKWEPADDLAAYLGGLPGVPEHADGGVTGGPLILPLRMDLSGNGWKDLLDAINTAGEDVALDLSACTISGTEFDPDYTITTGKGYIVSLILPDEATGIKAGTSYSTSTFKNFGALKSVSGGAVTGVGDYAFYGCALESVSFPAATTIGDQAFLYCTDLATVSLPAAATISDAAFYRCTALATVSLPAATTIGRQAFSGCTTLETVSLPAATTIGDQAFLYCTDLATVSLPAATSIGEAAFAYCTALATVSLPAATTIGGNAFQGCTDLEAVSLPAATTIGIYAFYGCTDLATVSLPAAKTIGSRAFVYCTALATVSLPAATTIGDQAFLGCTALETVSLPAATTIGGAAFAYTGTKGLTVTLGAAPPELGMQMFYGVASPKSVTVKVPSGALDSYGPSPTNTTANTWGNGFRGGGWKDGAMTGGAVNSNISLTIKAEDTP